MMMKQFLSIVLVTFSLSAFNHVYAQTIGRGYYRLTTQWTGKGKALDVVNDGSNDKLILGNLANVSGQFWKLTSSGNGYYRLTNQWQGEEKSLDIVNDGVNNQVRMAKSSNAAGQSWKLTSLGNGYYRLTNQWLGEKKSLDVINDGINNKLQMANTNKLTGQFWQIALVASEDETDDNEKVTMEDFKAVILHGFKVMVKKGTEEEKDTKEIMAMISEKLEEITNAINPDHLKILRNVPIWLAFKKNTTNNALAWCHVSEDWLVNNGYPAQMVNSVEVCHIRNFIDFQQNQPYNVILHEMGHAYHYSLSQELKNKITAAYRNAVKSKKYERVVDFTGQVTRHYALDNEDEYFAELTTTFFSRGYYVPFTKQELKEFDPMGYKLMQELWEQD
jgi:Ricin-type beta-trefoil lectin domain-like